MSNLDLLVPGARVLVTGAGITGRSVSAVLEPTGVRLTICDDDPLALQRLITPAKVVTVAEAQAQHRRLRPRGHQSGFLADCTRVGRGRRRGRADLG